MKFWFSSRLARVASALALASPLAFTAIPAFAGSDGYTPALVNGWKGAAHGTFNASLTSDTVVVTLSGGISSNGTNPVLFTLLPQFRPQRDVYVHASLCNSQNGRL